MKMVSEEDEADLATAPTEEDIAEVFNFDEAKSVDIQLIAEFDQYGENMVAIGGTTYPFKDILVFHGFQFDRTMHFWLAPAGTDTEDIETMMADYGFPVEKFDNAMEEA